MCTRGKATTRTADDFERPLHGRGSHADDVERRIDEARAGSPKAVEPPSPAELAVLRLLATDLTQREIGSELFLSMNTVKTHTRNLYGKLGVSSREEAVHQANVLGLIVSDDSPR